MKTIISILAFFSFNSFAQVSVIPGDVVEASHFNNLQTQIMSLKSILKNKRLYKEYVLWSGNSYLDGSSSYNLWSSSLHKNWDELELHIAYDNGSNPKVFTIDLGPNYSYGNTSMNYQVLLKVYATIYRRLIVTTTGLNIVNGGGSSVFYLKKVVGKIKTKVPNY